MIVEKRKAAAATAISAKELTNSILSAVEERASTGTVCPSEIARSLWPEEWRNHLEEIRQVASQLSAAELLQVTQRGRQVELSNCTGPVRLKASSVVPPTSRFQGRLGLCCQFSKEPIAFRTTTATSLSRLPRDAQLQKLSALCVSNVRALRAALAYCSSKGIGAFRIASSLFPVQTHPQTGYCLDDLPDAGLIRDILKECQQFAAQQSIRTSFHPDQFVVLNSPRQDVIDNSLKDLAAHAELADLVGADVINIHGGGAFGDKPAALKKLIRQILRLPDRIRNRLTLENDDRIFTPSDLLPVCKTTGVPLVYDVHHHRCHPDGLSVAAATDAALSTWNREPLFHLSSPLEGWTGPRPERHHDEIHPGDFPRSWLTLAITVDVEAKGKETAVLKLMKYLGHEG